MSDDQGKTQGEHALQFSVYPVRQADIDSPIRAAIKAASDAGAEVRVGTLSTLALGDEETVFRAARAAFTAAKSFGPTVMVLTLTSGHPSVETVSEIQRSI